jgi:hypothetical protein
MTKLKKGVKLKSGVKLRDRIEKPKRFKRRLYVGKNTKLA